MRGIRVFFSNVLPLQVLSRVKSTGGTTSRLPVPYNRYSMKVFTTLLSKYPHFFPKANITSFKQHHIPDPIFLQFTYSIQPRQLLSARPRKTFPDDCWNGEVDGVCMDWAKLSRKQLPGAAAKFKKDFTELKQITEHLLWETATNLKRERQLKDTPLSHIV